MEKPRRRAALFTAPHRGATLAVQSDDVLFRPAAKFIFFPPCFSNVVNKQMVKVCSCHIIVLATARLYCHFGALEILKKQENAKTNLKEKKKLLIK